MCCATLPICCKRRLGRGKVARHILAKEVRKRASWLLPTLAEFTKALHCILKLKRGGNGAGRNLEAGPAFCVNRSSM